MSALHAYPSLPRSAVASRFELCARSLPATLAALQHETGLPPRRHAPPAPAPAATATAAGGASGRGERRPLAAAIARALPWVTTGAAVATLYAACRAEPSALAKARNTAFERATTAYTRGDVAVAARMSRQGRALDDRMRQAHRAAAASIFTARNAGGGALPPPAPLTALLPDGTRQEVRVAMLDLHGLHPQEAAAVVTAALQVAPGDTWVALLVGTRHHSHALGKGGGSLAAAVGDTLDALAAEWYTASAGGADAAGGALMVYARPSS